MSAGAWRGGATACRGRFPTIRCTIIASSLLQFLFRHVDITVEGWSWIPSHLSRHYHLPSQLLQAFTARRSRIHCITNNQKFTVIFTQPTRSSGNYLTSQILRPEYASHRKRATVRGLFVLHYNQRRRIYPSAGEGYGQRVHYVGSKDHINEIIQTLQIMCRACCDMRSITDNASIITIILTCFALPYVPLNQTNNRPPHIPLPSEVPRRAWQASPTSFPGFH